MRRYTGVATHKSMFQTPISLIFNNALTLSAFQRLRALLSGGGGGGGGREGKSLLYAHAYIKNHEFGWGVIVMTSRASVMTYPIYYKILPTLLLDFSISASEAQNRWLILSVASRSPPY